MKKLLTTMTLALTVCIGAQAQRFTDKLDRGLVAVQTTAGVYCSWRIQADEYYDVKYNLYRDGTKVNDTPLEVSNYTDPNGKANSKYTVKPVVDGTEKEDDIAVTAEVLPTNYKTVTLQHDASLKATYIPNDACCADVDGDGELEILMKFTNQEEADQRFPVNGPTIGDVETKEYALLEVFKQNGKLLWWVNCGPNMGDFQNNEQNIVGYDWDMDGKAEVVMRLEEGSQVHMSDGTVYTIGADGKNGTTWTNYRYPKGDGTVEWFTYYGNEFLWYCEGATGKPYQCIEYPLKRYEKGETSLEEAWGDGYGHRSSKYFFGAPYLDGKTPSIFLGRGIYTRHKFIAYAVDPTTHSLTTQWKWTNNQGGSPWYGQGYHNYTIADVDWDGRDEIVWGSMVIDDNGKGLSTTGLGHGDSQHVGDFNPYIHGQEIFACNEDQPANNYRDGTTSKIYYRMLGTEDAGRALAGNFYDEYPGATGYGAHDTPISCVTNDHEDVNTNGLGMNFRIFWDGDLLEECFDNVTVSKPGYGVLETFPGVASNNSTKATPCYQGDIFGDWREEIIERDTTNNLQLRIFTTTTPTSWRNYSLWYDTQYRNAMVWEPCGYNQPPHVSYFLGEKENITLAPPPITTTGRVEVGSSIGTDLNGKHALLSYSKRDYTVNVEEGASPAIFTDNAPSWVQGSAASECTTKDTPITYKYYTHTLTGAAFTGSMRLVKQGDGTLVLPNVTETYTGKTDVWAGKLSFDGTMASSPVWLNRFAELNSNGGNFKGGISADYGSVIRPGGENTVGVITVSDLKLNFGSRVIFDYDGRTDSIKATAMTIEKKNWDNGPEYSTPVFEFTTHPDPGIYTLAEVANLTGKVSDIKVEGLKGIKYILSYTDNKILLNILKARDAQTTKWTGASGSTWDLMESENFNSSDKQFVTGDKITFDDTAENTDVNITESLMPGSVEFCNNTKSYTLSGEGSIEGTTSLAFNGAGTVTINNTNKYSGGTYLNNGTLVPMSLANTDGASYGALGGATDPIHIDNAVFKTTKTISSSQPIIIHENGATFDVTGNLNLSGGISENSSSDVTTIHKLGNGTLTLNNGTPIGVDTLYIDKGIVYDYGDAHFHDKTIVLNGGTLRYRNSIYSYDGNSKDGTSGENATFIVPKGKTPTLYLDGRCDYVGRLFGEGTLNLHSTWVRCPIWGNWSEFTGTINAYQDGTYSSYDPTFDFANTYGIGNAILNIQPGCTVHTNGKDFAIGALKGSGAIDNGGFWNYTGNVNTLTIGGKNTDFAFTGAINTCNVNKVGTGKWTVANEGILTNAGEIRINDGMLFLNLITANISLTGTAGTTIGSGAQLAGVGLTANLTLESGAAMRIGTYTTESQYTSNNKNIRVIGTFNAKSGSDVYFNIVNTGKEGITSRSHIVIKSATDTPVFDGNVHLTYKSTLTLTEGMTFTLVELPSGVTMTGTPTFDLQSLPSGLAWDTSSFMTTGQVKVVNGTSIATLKSDSDAVTATVVSSNGTITKTIKSTAKTLKKDLRALGLPQGVYVVKIQKGGKVTVKSVTL